MAEPLERNFLGRLFGRPQTQRVRPTQTLGHMGTAVFGGYVVENEKEAALTDRERYRTFSQILANCSIAAASVRYFLNLTAAAGWTFEPADDPRGEELAEMTEQALTEDPETSWARIVRRAAMYRFYGFSTQEWTAMRRADGTMTYRDIAPRAQITIERWDVNTDGTVNGVVQRSPQDQQETYLPRGKLLYMVDDSLNDSPQGLGLLRHVVQPARRLERYEQLEGFGYETDLRGIPIGRAPYAELRSQLANGQITQSEMTAAVNAIEAFIKKHIKNPELGLVLDSEPYVTTDDAQRPSNQPKFDMSLLEGSQTSLPDMARAIERINLEIARLLGTESIILGDGDGGSHALSRDKTNQFSLTVDGTLAEIADSMRRDLLRPLFQLNGWPEGAMPEMKPEAVQYRDVEQIARSLRDMAAAGAVMGPDDPAIAEFRALIGLSPPDQDEIDEDLALRPARQPTEAPNDADEQMPQRGPEDGA